MLTQSAILILLPALTLAVNLKPYNATAHMMFLESDVNGDSRMTQDEVNEIFKGYDTNRDGRVTRKEYTDFTNKHTPTLHDLSHALYDIYDVDHDHHLDRHDFENFFDLLDADNNDIVNEPEFVKFWVKTFTDLEHLHVPGITP